MVQAIDVQAVVLEQVAGLRDVAVAHDNTVRVRCDAPLAVHAPRQLLGVVVALLLRDAFAGSRDTTIEVVVGDAAVRIGGSGRDGYERRTAAWLIEPYGWSLAADRDGAVELRFAIGTQQIA
jgi:hypothetical protein